MHIPIPIPIGTKHVAEVRGAVWKFVSCTSCKQPFAYLMELEATGEDHDLLFLDGEGSAERAGAKAEENFAQKSKNLVLPIPCPTCGYYQDDMSQLLKEDASINLVQIGGLLLTMISPIPLLFDIEHRWLLTIVCAAAGLVTIVYGTVLAFRFDPNAGDPEARKILGRSHTVWGQQLEDSMMENETTARNHRVVRPE